MEIVHPDPSKKPSETAQPVVVVKKGDGTIEVIQSDTVTCALTELNGKIVRIDNTSVVSQKYFQVENHNNL